MTDETKADCIAAVVATMRSTREKELDMLRNERYKLKEAVLTMPKKPPIGMRAKYDGMGFAEVIVVVD